MTAVVEYWAATDSVNRNTIDEIDGRFPEHTCDVAMKEAKLWFHYGWITHPTNFSSLPKLDFVREDRQKEVLGKNLLL